MEFQDQRLGEVGERIEQAARGVGRDPKSVTLIAVGKTYGANHIRPVIESGQINFGENRVQEALSKWPDLKAAFPDIQLHLIGPLQSNKVKQAVALFDVIHTVDREKIAQAIAEEMARTNKKLKLLVQVNSGEEPQKAGLLPSEVDAFVRSCESQWGLEIAGLMSIPPVGEEAALHFALLAKIAKRLGLADLSMGMSGDFEKAVQFGATYVRVGTVIFGARER